MRASCVRAIDRLDYMGIFCVQLFHLEMSKCASDILAAIPNINNDDDRGFLGHLLTLVGVNGRFSNLKKKIVKNYEWHSQFLKEIWSKWPFMAIWPSGHGRPIVASEKSYKNVAQQ